MHLVYKWHIAAEPAVISLQPFAFAAGGHSIAVLCGVGQRYLGTDWPACSSANVVVGAYQVGPSSSIGKLRYTELATRYTASGPASDCQPERLSGLFGPRAVAIPSRSLSRGSAFAATSEAGRERAGGTSVAAAVRPDDGWPGTRYRIEAERSARRNDSRSRYRIIISGAKP